MSNINVNSFYNNFPPHTTRPPAVAGMFYPNNMGELNYMLAQFFNFACNDLQNITIPVVPKILISPHAGYVYSGIVAAYGYCALYKHLKNSDIFSDSGDKISKLPHTFIILAPAHTVYLNGIAIDPHTKWQLPFGQVYLNKKLANKLIENLSFAQFNTTAHQKEHAVEVQIPFLQFIFSMLNSVENVHVSKEQINDTNFNKNLLKQANKMFNIVPIVIGELSKEQLREFATFLSKVIKDRPNIKIIVSSDLSHYLPYALAKEVDSNTINTIVRVINSKQKQPETGLKAGVTNDIFTISLEQACGAYGINTVIQVAKKLNYKAKALKYLNSGDTAGDLSAVVGYTSIIIGPKIIKK